MGRLSIYFSLKREAEKAAKEGKSLADGWREFTIRGVTHLESYITLEYGRQTFKECYQRAKEALPKEAPPEEPQEGFLNIGYIQDFPKAV